MIQIVVTIYYYHNHKGQGAWLEGHMTSGDVLIRPFKFDIFILPPDVVNVGTHKSLV
jgi:hypothetical protein